MILPGIRVMLLYLEHTEPTTTLLGLGNCWYTITRPDVQFVVIIKLLNNVITETGVHSPKYITAEMDFNG